MRDSPSSSKMARMRDSTAISRSCSPLSFGVTRSNGQASELHRTPICKGRGEGNTSTFLRHLFYAFGDAVLSSNLISCTLHSLSRCAVWSSSDEANVTVRSFHCDCKRGFFFKHDIDNIHDYTFRRDIPNN